MVTRAATPFSILEDPVREEAKQHFKIRTTRPDEENGEHGNDYEDGEEMSETDSEGGAVDPLVQEDIRKFEESFKGVSKKYRLVDRIGEGTFSTVYKAEDLLYDEYENDWDIESRDRENNQWSPSRRKSKPRYVAIKKIYVTSSPQRVQNELELLYDLQDCECICPLITAFRHHDQIVAVLPYYQHDDFRDFFREMTAYDIQVYFRNLFTGLRWVHNRGIIHRDIKPTNFLYNRYTQRGVLVDFGLAERELSESGRCYCEYSDERRSRKVNESYVARNGKARGYPKEDTRPSRRANRAGTRGFRAPEVLFKCTNQTCSLDVWSCGVILLTILSNRFPFFNSTDDIDALLELMAVFGQQRIKNTGLLHGAVVECSIPGMVQNGYNFTKLVAWSTVRKPADISDEEKIIHGLLEKLLELDFRKRYTADEALEHEFFQMNFAETDDPQDDVEELMVDEISDEN